MVRFEWPCPGDLLQMDTKRFGRFDRARAAGHRRPPPQRRRETRPGGLGVLSLDIDDHPRIAYSELHRDEKAATVVAFCQRALAFYNALGIQPRRLQTDNAWTYTHNTALKALLVGRGVGHESG